MIYNGSFVGSKERTQNGASCRKTSGLADWNCAINDSLNTEASCNTNLICISKWVIYWAISDEASLISRPILSIITIVLGHAQKR